MVVPVGYDLHTQDNHAVLHGTHIRVLGLGGVDLHSVSARGYLRHDVLLGQEPSTRGVLLDHGLRRYQRRMRNGSKGVEFMELTPQNVQDTAIKCFYHTDEIVDGKTPEGAVLVEGVVARYGFHPERLEAQRDNIRSMLLQLPKEFMSKDVDPEGGEGWSFLNACNRADGVQWTGLHKIMDDLFCLGIGLGMVEYLLPREQWKILPGAVPYIIIK